MSYGRWLSSRDIVILKREKYMYVDREEEKVGRICRILPCEISLDWVQAKNAYWKEKEEAVYFFQTWCDLFVCVQAGVIAARGSPAN